MDINDPHLLLQILFKSPNYIFWKDLNSRYQGCNYNFAKACGFTHPEEVIGKTDDDMRWGKYTGHLYKAEDLEIIQTGKPILDKEVPMTIGDQEERILSVSKVPLYNERQNIIGILGIYIDITHRVRMEEELRIAMQAAEASNRAKSEFIANMSHDVRTPLGSIYSMTDILSMQLEDPEVVDQLKMLSQASKQLLNFFNNCIEMVRMEAGEVALQEENFQIRKLMNEVAELYEPTIYLKKLKFYLHCSRNLPEEIYASKEGLQAIILNLLSNALKFTKQGSVKLSVSVDQNSDGAGRIKVQISDTGIGISADKLPTIFDRFSRGTPSYEGVYEGHGLGLHIVQKFIHLMRGEVSVETEVGKGSCFTLSFPFKEPQEGKTKIPKERFRAEAQAKTESKPKPSILVVEDNPTGQMAIKLILNKLDYEVEMADTAEKVFDRLESSPYALIFMDVGMEGDEITTAIRRSERIAQSPRTPIIGLTAYTDPETMQKCIAAGMDEVILKPLTEEAALTILNDYVQKDG